ncbi:MAG: CaiB/BaiF CoA-transferase family protein [Bacteroidia bacterium]|nr:CoA transferase [Bacteroidia bacterium]MDW8158155.1 CaiB/BaiF CoA-transferase family protein [Bacteroidia bacterium]
MQQLPLEDLLVIELASVLAGPAVGAFLAELGATVIKVENLQGDVTRTWLLPEEKPKDGISAYFSCVNWGKKSIALDLKYPEGKAILNELLQRADILITNFKPSSARRLGFAYEQIAHLYPHLIYGEITGYGNQEERVGYDAVLQAESGFMYLNSSPEGNPQKMPVALIDLIAAHHLKEGILLALYNRQKTGLGTKVSCSLLHAAITALANQATAVLFANYTPEPLGTEHPSIFPYGTLFYTQENKPILVAIGNDEQFSTFCQILQIPEIAQDPQFATNPRRVQNREILRPLLAEKIKLFHFDTLLYALHQNQIPAGAVHTVNEALALPQVTPLLLHSPIGKGLKTIAFETPLLANTDLPPPPKLGEHTQEILQEWLFYEESTFLKLKNKGIIQ